MAHKIDKNNPIDRYSQAILDLLAADGRLSVSELARRVGLSKSPCQARLTRLLDEGYILGFRAVLNPAKLQRDHVAFAEVKLSDTTEQALSAFNREVVKIAEVEECYMIAGAFDYLVKVRTRDIGAYRRVMGERISALPHVASTSTLVAMEAVKETSI